MSLPTSTPNYSGLDWIPEIVYTNCGAPTTWTGELPQGYFTHWSNDIGGSDEADSGAQESFVLRTDIGTDVILRFFEDDWVNVRLMISTIRNEAVPFTIQFDKADATTLYTVDLVSPQVGERFSFSRSAEFPQAGELAITVRESSGSPIDMPWDPRV